MITGDGHESQVVKANETRWELSSRIDNYQVMRVQAGSSPCAALSTARRVDE